MCVLPSLSHPCLAARTSVCAQDWPPYMGTPPDAKSAQLHLPCAGVVAGSQELLLQGPSRKTLDMTGVTHFLVTRERYLALFCGLRRLQLGRPGPAPSAKLADARRRLATAYSQVLDSTILREFEGLERKAVGQLQERLRGWKLGERPEDFAQLVRELHFGELRLNWRENLLNPNWDEKAGGGDGPLGVGAPTLNIGEELTMLHALLRDRETVFMAAEELTRRTEARAARAANGEADTEDSDQEEVKTVVAGAAGATEDRRGAQAADEPALPTDLQSSDSDAAELGDADSTAGGSAPETGAGVHVPREEVVTADPQGGPQSVERSVNGVEEERVHQDSSVDTRVPSGPADCVVAEADPLDVRDLAQKTEPRVLSDGDGRHPQPPELKVAPEAIRDANACLDSVAPVDACGAPESDAGIAAVAETDGATVDISVAEDENAPEDHRGYEDERADDGAAAADEAGEESSDLDEDDNDADAEDVDDESEPEAEAAEELADGDDGDLNGGDEEDAVEDDDEVDAEADADEEPADDADQEEPRDAAAEAPADADDAAAAAALADQEGDMFAADRSVLLILRDWASVQGCVAAMCMIVIGVPQTVGQWEFYLFQWRVRPVALWLYNLWMGALDGPRPSPQCSCARRVLSVVQLSSDAARRRHAGRSARS
jgi:hypothetical protein